MTPPAPAAARACPHRDTSAHIPRKSCTRAEGRRGLPRPSAPLAYGSRPDIRIHSVGAIALPIDTRSGTQDASAAGRRARLMTRLRGREPSSLSVVRVWAGSAGQRAQSAALADGARQAVRYRRGARRRAAPPTEAIFTPFGPKH
ncbi:hypothetical protein EVAR_13628_1 [Eumeta japonica]|uniref:Uncharacterized protein n=1 Tax=Eumeta variegata TaxID=151549 RepID=A0A4C1UTF2_EUMVA|nr:hypothetical protein EVAR_13628_1 [Eumeta japonica]